MPDEFRVRARIKAPPEPNNDEAWFARRVQLGEWAVANNDPPHASIIEGLAEDTEALKQAREG